jgi:hypothetical protein
MLCSVVLLCLFSVDMGWAQSTRALPQCYEPFAKAGQLDLFYQFDLATPGLAVNQVRPGTGDLYFVSQSPYGVWRGAMVNPINKKTMPHMELGRDGLLNAVQSGTFEGGFSPTGWLPDFDHGYAISFWLRVRDVAEFFSGVVMNLDTGYKNGWRIEFTKAKWAKQGKLSLVCGTDKNSTYLGTQSFLTEQWHHVVFVAEQGKMTLYVDGLLVKQSDEPLNMPKPDKPDQWFLQDKPQRGLRLFHKWYSKAVLLDCRMDEFAGFNTALTAEQVQSLYQAGQPQAIDEENKTQQLLRLEAEDKRRQSLASLDMQIDGQSYGYLPAGQPINLTFSTQNSELIPTVATYKLTASDGTVVHEKQLPMPSHKNATVKEQITISKPGLYLLTMQMLDDQGRQLNVKRYPLGVTPGFEQGSESASLSWLGAQNLLLRPEPQALNMGLTRVVCNWRDIEPASGEYDWSSSDQSLLSTNLSQMPYMVCVTGFPKWADVKPQGKISDKTIEAYQQFMKKILARYQHVQYWEIWDAAEWIPSGQLQIEQYRKLLRAASTEIRAVSGNKKVVSGAAWQLTAHWVQDLLKDGGGDLIDMLAVQTHFQQPASKGKLATHLQHVKSVCQRLGYSQMPIWNTGLGLHQAVRSGNFPDASQKITESSWPISLVNEHDAATWMVQSLVMQLADGVQSIILDPSPASFYPDLNPMDGLPSIKGLAIAMLGNTLGNAPQIKQVKNSPKGIAVFEFTQAHGRSGLIAYALDQPMTLTVKPASPDKAMQVRNMVGQALSINDSQTIELGQEPIYLLHAIVE